MAGPIRVHGGSPIDGYAGSPGRADRGTARKRGSKKRNERYERKRMKEKSDLSANKIYHVYHVPGRFTSNIHVLGLHCRGMDE